MKTKKILFNSLTGLLFSALLITGCRKHEEDNDTAASQDNAFAESCFDDLSNIADQAAWGGIISYKNSNDNSGFLSGCATVSFDTVNHTDVDTIKVDFGTTNCQCVDGRYRRGVIEIIYNGLHYRDSGMTAVITPKNYFVNDNQIIGTKSITNKGHINGNLTWDIVVNGQVVLANNGGTITWNTNKTKELLAGETSYNGPINWLIAKIGITGSTTGTSASGVNFIATVTSQLIRDFTCGQYRKYFVQGKFDFTPGNKLTRHVDFGNGNCDNIATVTIGKNTYTVHMK